MDGELEHHVSACVIAKLVKDIFSFKMHSTIMPKLLNRYHNWSFRFFFSKKKRRQRNIKKKKKLIYILCQRGRYNLFIKK